MFTLKYMEVLLTKRSVTDEFSMNIFECTTLEFSFNNKINFPYEFKQNTVLCLKKNGVNFFTKSCL